MKKNALLVFVSVLLSTAVFVRFVRPVETSGTIYIRADGSVEGTTHISTVNNVTYTFTGNIYDEIVVERSNITIDGNGYTLQGTGTGNGFYLSGVNNATIKNTDIKGFEYGIYLASSSFNTVSRNNITNNWAGIWISSSGNSVSGNNITANSGYGIYLYHSSGNSVSGNNITANDEYGIYLNVASNNGLRDNRMANNTYNFGVYGLILSDFLNDINASNTVDGKLIYYWVGRQNATIPSDAGYVALVNCTGIRVENLTLTRNDQGILLAYTVNSIIAGNNIAANYEYGIYLYSSSGNSISGNNITNSRAGIYLFQSSNNTISGNYITDAYGWDSKGVLVEKSSNNVIDGNILINNDRGGIELAGSSNNTISANEVRDNGDWANDYGIELTYYGGYYSDNNTIIGNNVTGNKSGIKLCVSYYNNVVENNVINNTYTGVQFETASYNTFRNNTIAGNEHNFGVFTFYDEVRLSTYTQDIDTSNTVNGKPIYYLVDQNGLTIDSSDIGYLGLVNCTNIHIDDVTLSNNGQGLLLAFTTNSTIENVTIAKNNVGIHVLSSDANLITASTLTNNAFGISLYRSSSNNITKNTLTNNGYGSGFYYGCVLIGRLVMAEGVLKTTKTIPSEDNIISSNMISNNGGGIILSNPGTTRTLINGNTISQNGEGIYVEYGASNNKIYHNNFINNTNQVYQSNSYNNTWDDGYPSGGNYWSDYTDVDEKSGPDQGQTGSDGIADNPYIIDADNNDTFPLMGPISFFDAGTYNEVTYYVHTVSNSTVSDFYFNPAEGPFIKFNVTDSDGSKGFCRVTIPKAMLWVKDGPWLVLVGGDPPETTAIFEDGDHTYIYFTYYHSKKTVEIRGTGVIPEFPKCTSMLLILIILTVAIAIYKRRLLKKF